MSSRPAIAAVARHEWRARGRAVMVIGVVAGLLGGGLVAGFALIRRTDTAPDRLMSTVSPGDAHLQVFEEPEGLLDLPMIERSWSAQLAIGQLEGDTVTYLAVVAGPRRPSGMFEPIVVEGRAARDDRADEIMILEDVAAQLGLVAGDRIRMALLAPEEVFQFDVGFGEPDGPTLDLLVTGLIRVPPGVLDQSPVLASAAFAEANRGSTVGTDHYVDLVGGRAQLPELRAAVDALVDGLAVGEGAEEFPPAAVNDLHDGVAAARRSTGVLVGGMVVAALVATLAGVLALGQGMVRHHSGSIRNQEIERALGMARSARATGRAVPAVAAAGVGVMIAFGVGASSAWIAPPGAARRLEPHPGWSLNIAVLLIGSIGVAVAIVVAGWLAAYGAGRRQPIRSGASSRLAVLVPRWRGWVLAGAAFALAPPRGSRRLPVRAALIGAVCGCVGLVGGVAFDASLDRLVAEPVRYGWDADLAVVDVTDEIARELHADERLDAVSVVDSSTVRIGDNEVPAYAVTHMRGRASWTLLSGREPGVGEVVLGSRLAADLGLTVGDEATVAGAPLAVVGIGVGPVLGAEPFGTAVMVASADLPSLSSMQPFHEALVSVGPGSSVDEVVADLGSRYEIGERSIPAPVRDLAELGALPVALGLFLVAVSGLVLAHALAVTARQRARDLAVLHALGSTPIEVGAAVGAMAMTTVVAGIVLGVPLGLLVARLVWHEVARATGVAGDLLISTDLVVTAIAVIVVACLAAVVPAVRAATTDRGSLLRGD